MVNLAVFSGPVTVQWFDPTNGTYSPVSGSPFANSGTQTFTPATFNSQSDGDWVMLFQVK
jgi:hypothetical protein